MYKLSIWILVAWMAATGALAQGPLDGYMKGKGHLDLAPSFSFLRGQTFQGAQNQRFDLPWQGSMLSLFAEYGLTSRLDLVFTGNYVFTENNSGLQDGSFHVKYRPFYRETARGDRLSALLATGLGFPLAQYEILAAGALGQRAVTVPLAMMVQWETAPGIFFHAQGAYHHRMDRIRDEDVEVVRRQRPDYDAIRPASFYTALLKVGFPARRFYTDVWLQQQWTPGGADYVPNVPDLPQAYGVSFTQVGGVLYYSENGRNGFLISWGKVLGGRNVNLMGRITLGAVFKLGGTKE